MQIDLEPALPGKNYIQAYANGIIIINHEAVATNLIITPTLKITWTIESFLAIDENQLQQLLSYKPEVIIIGTGIKPFFLKPHLFSYIHQKGVGIECMTTSAACRTFNIMVNEERNVLAALIH